MSEDTDRANASPAEERFSLMWRRVKEHRIAQWTVGYVAVAYAIQHAIVLTVESLDWPHAVERVSMLLLALGLPLAIVLAWYHGERTAKRVSSGELAVVSVVLLGISLAFYLFVRPAGDVLARSGVQEASLVGPAQAGGNSLAVLPFANLSRDPDQEFFSDGMTDAIMAALAKVQSLRVVGRQSAFQFKADNQDNRKIGLALGARYLVEGSVQKAAERIRITAQLVRADDGVSLWTETYDRELKDVFALQDDVGRAIAASLQAPLGLKQGDSLVPDRAIIPDAYLDYLRAKALFRARKAGVSLDAPLALLENMVAKQPNYAPAWALLSQVYGFAPVYDPSHLSGTTDQFRQVVDRDLPLAEAAARRAIELDPRGADGYVGLGEVQNLRGRRVEAEQSFRRGLAIDPLNPDALQMYSERLEDAGLLRDAAPMREQLLSLEPLVPVYNAITTSHYLATGDTKRALAVAQTLPPDYGFPGSYIGEGTVYAAMGQYKLAADKLSGVAGYPREQVDAAARLLRMAPSHPPSGDVPSLGALDFVFTYTGLPERSLESYERRAITGYQGFSGSLWAPNYREARRTDRFKAFVRSAGLVDYWKARGWPDLCHPIGADDFACE